MEQCRGVYYPGHVLEGLRINDDGNEASAHQLDGVSEGWGGYTAEVAFVSVSELTRVQNFHSRSMLPQMQASVQSLVTDKVPLRPIP